ncbi:RagB/SusD family nutrient uptake outer membrane protein [Duncaniella freteri]|uniref:RagB/SusD family nutrient uptake outer membrane protein n=4 Tax=Duncaniella TaxID=2518495 RepID=UPI002577B3B5|nr:RagB/SusD family nutrient uptake outer membrane protein [Duncaniella freteri]
MKKYISGLSKLLLLAGALVAASCTDYLDKAPGSDIDENEPYKNFRNFQGFVEELYGGIPCISSTEYHNSWNLGEDEYWEPSDVRPLAYQIDQGNYRVISDGGTFIYGFPGNGNGNPESDKKTDKGNLWKLAWKCIRKANIGLANMDKLQGATAEERNLIEGQLLFFRGWYHFMLMQYWGGLPYIDHVLPAGETPMLPRLNYRETAELAAADMEAAAKILPIDWDQTTAGRPTLGNNNMRANKIMALAFAGKCLLWAGSPLMNYESSGDASYNSELCKRAADLLGEALSLTESTGRYELADFSQWNDLFYYADKGGRVPGLKEVIMLENLVEFYLYNTRFDYNQRNDYFSQIVISGGVKVQPTANYALNYGMANGEPIPSWEESDAVSGYDPTHPWKGRDPRFYKDFAYDGIQMVRDDKGIVAEDVKYASLYSGGPWRVNNGNKSNLTGLVEIKFVPQMAPNIGGLLDIHVGAVLCLMRLSDLYLLYSEATACGYGSPTSKASTFGMTAVEAVNKVRARAGVGNVASRFTGSTDAFLPELYRERAVELAFEGHRFIDLRRWMLLTKRPYTLKTKLEFDRTKEFSFRNPSEARVANLREEVLFERKLDDRHYWLPLPTADVNIYPEFGQNPGW